MKWSGPLSALLFAAVTTQVLAADLILRGGTIVDGTGSPGYVADLGIRDGRLVLPVPGDNTSWAEAEVIDVDGMVVAPGFIDLHTHARADLVDPAHSTLSHYLTQGVTSVLIGNDGDGTVNIAQRFARIAEHGSGVNVAQYVGHSALRRATMDRTDRPATADEISAMKTLLARGLREGAMGLSSGLFYTDANHAQTSEVIALGHTLASLGGLYDSHIRSESSRDPGVIAAVEEAIQIGRESGIPVHIAHIKALGKDVWGSAPVIIELINAARQQGVRVTADQYPWQASSTQLKNAVLSRSWQAGGPDGWRRVLSDPEQRNALLEDIRTNTERRGGPGSLMIVRTGDERWDGRRLDQIAKDAGVSPEEMARRMLLQGTPRVISFNMQESDISAFMAQPWVATSSDGTVGHPRRYASFPRKYHRFVRELGLLSTEQFVRASSGLAADILGLEDRGYLRQGWVADVVVFDPDTYREAATYLLPERHSHGVRHLWVNGVPAIHRGEVTGHRAGQALTP